MDNIKRRTGRALKAPLYTLPHGIEVIGEYAPNANYPYWRVRVRPHPLIVGKVVCGGVYLGRHRAVATSVVGRILRPDEHVHHDNGKQDDDPKHLEVLAAAKHNAHHKTGWKHSQETKDRIAASLRLAHQEGRKNVVAQHGTAQSQAKLDDDKVRTIRASTTPAAVLARQFGVSKQVVLAVRNFKNWKHVK